MTNLRSKTLRFGISHELSLNDKFGQCKLCNLEDLTILIYHLTSREHVFKGLCNFMGGRPSQEIATLPCLVSIGLVQVEI